MKSLKGKPTIQFLLLLSALAVLTGIFWLNKRTDFLVPTKESTGNYKIPTYSETDRPNKLSLQFSQPSITKEGEFQYVQFTNSYPRYLEASPVLPVIVAAEIQLPREVSLNKFIPQLGEKQSLGELNIPCAILNPFSARGTKFIACNGEYVSLPSEAVWFDKIDGGIRILVSPVLYNSKSHETQYYKTIEISLEYK